MNELCTNVLDMDEEDSSNAKLNDLQVCLRKAQFLQKFILRNLTYKYTGPLSVLYGAAKSGKLHQYDMSHISSDLTNKKQILGASYYHYEFSFHMFALNHRDFMMKVKYCLCL